jgi:hypothetical protein
MQVSPFDGNRLRTGSFIDKMRHPVHRCGAKIIHLPVSISCEQVQIPTKSEPVLLWGACQNTALQQYLIQT